MAYVDLNPIRAEMVTRVEKSEYTSAFERIRGGCCEQEKSCLDMTSKPLFGFVAGECNDQPQGLPYALINYLELIDYSLPSMAQLAHLMSLLCLLRILGSAGFRGKTNYIACCIKDHC